MARRVSASDSLQKNYVYWCTEPVGKNFSPLFRPELSPKEMLELGVFEGCYFFGGIPKEFPAEWFARARLSEEPRPELNFFGVSASQSLEAWREKGWINEEHDPHGWFQWYCRYYLGRRLGEEDERQMRRWRQMKRHASQVRKHCMEGDFSCRRRQRQALLHWAYDSRKI